MVFGNLLGFQLHYTNPFIEANVLPSGEGVGALRLLLIHKPLSLFYSHTNKAAQSIALNTAVQPKN